MLNIPLIKLFIDYSYKAVIFYTKSFADQS